MSRQRSIARPSPSVRDGAWTGLALLALSATAFGQGAPIGGKALVTASPNPSLATVGDTVVVTLRVGLAGVSGMSSEGFATPAVLGGYQVSVAFDNTRLHFESATGGTTAGYSATPVYSSPAVANSSGVVTLVGSQTAPTAPIGEVTVALLTFTAMAAGTATLSASPVSLVSALQPGPPSVGPTGLPFSGAGTTVAISDTPPPTPTPGPSLQFFSIAPCRLVDTRSASAPSLAGGATRTFAADGCGIPPTARALAVNVTVTQPTAGGDLRIFPAGSPLPLASAIAYRANQTRAATTVVSLNDSGEFSVRCDQGVGTTTHFVLDVAGYFE